MDRDEAGRSNGDPQGRRLARRRVTHLSEAGRLAQALDVLLQKAGVSSDELHTLQRRITREEKACIQRSEGRIESRKRFKCHSPHPLLDKRPVINLFIDEAGKSTPEPRNQTPFFALGGVALSSDAVTRYCKGADELKREFFGRSDLTFHEPAMRRREEPYYFEGDINKQMAFDSALRELLARTDFTAFGVGVRKAAFQKEFVENGLDPYLPTDAYSVAIQMLLERFVDFLATRSDRKLGQVSFESQGPKEDVLHQLDYARTLADGTQWVPESAFRYWLEPGLRFLPKSGTHPMEIADLWVRDIFEWVRSNCSHSPKFWDALGRKIYCREDGAYGKFGLKVFPDSDLRAEILAHRVLCGATPQKLKAPPLKQERRRQRKSLSTDIVLPY